jgi:hypothetical protein
MFTRLLRLFPAHDVIERLADTHPVTASPLVVDVKHIPNCRKPRTVLALIYNPHVDINSPPGQLSEIQTTSTESSNHAINSTPHFVHNASNADPVALDICPDEYARWAITDRGPEELVEIRLLAEDRGKPP